MEVHVYTLSLFLKAFCIDLHPVFKMQSAKQFCSYYRYVFAALGLMQPRNVCTMCLVPQLSQRKYGTTLHSIIYPSSLCLRS